jgi:hypothetical protein
MLLLKRHLVALVRAGKKRQTIRLWSRPLLRPGQISYTPGLGKMLITHVDQLAGLKDLTEADAIADGFTDLKSLMAEIRRIYGAAIPKNRNVYRIRFQWPLDDNGKPTPPPKHEATRTRTTTKKSPPAAHALPPARRTSRHMTRTQRESLRTFILARAPRP